MIQQKENTERTGFIEKKNKWKNKNVIAIHRHTPNLAMGYTRRAIVQGEHTQYVNSEHLQQQQQPLWEVDEALKITPSARGSDPLTYHTQFSNHTRQRCHLLLSKHGPLTTANWSTQGGIGYHSTKIDKYRRLVSKKYRAIVV